MPIIKEIRDEGPNGLPSVEERRKSQAEGATGKGTNEQTMVERMNTQLHQGPNPDDVQGVHGLPKR